jgi:hypothetical protein
MHAGDPLYPGHARPRAGVDEDQIGAQLASLAAVQAHLQRFRTAEACSAEQEIHALGRLDPSLAAAAELLDDVALSLPDLRHIHAHGADLNAIVGRAARQIGHPPARHHGLGGGTSLVDAGAPNMLALDQRGSAAGAG